MQCIYCQQVRAKNTSRQRQHLLECPTYLSVMKDSIPANNLLHTFPEGDVARSLQIPAPTLELDFRMSIKMNPKVSVGPGVWGQREWVSFVGGQWAGRWGKGIVLVSLTIAVRGHSIFHILTIEYSPAAKIPRSLPRTRLPICAPVIFSRPSMSHQHSSSSARKDG